MADKPKILVVEDNPADVFLIEEALRDKGVAADMRAIDDGEQAIHLLDSIDSGDESAFCPELLLLDLNLPKLTGTEILERLRRSGRCRDIPVIIVTSSNSSHDRERVALLGATHYFRKPTNLAEFLQLGEVVKCLLPDAGRGNR